MICLRESADLLSMKIALGTYVFSTIRKASMGIGLHMHEHVAVFLKCMMRVLYMPRSHKLALRAARKYPFGFLLLPSLGKGGHVVARR